MSETNKTPEMEVTNTEVTQSEAKVEAPEVAEEIKSEPTKKDTLDVNFEVGNTIKVYQKIKEGDKFRTQVFDGLVIAMKKNLGITTFTVRKVSFGIGVEKMFSSASKFIEKIEIVKKAKVRRAKLFYMRGLTGKKARLKEEYVYNK